MREILFRGKRIYNGECVYGYHFYDSFRNKAFITPGTNTFRFDTLDGRKKSNNYLVTCFEVAPESISQSTGLEDTNGTPIFEGDIATYVEDGLRGDFSQGVMEIVWNEKTAGFCGRTTQGRLVEITHLKNVIGNIHDNPELLEVN